MFNIIRYNRCLILLSSLSTWLLSLSSRLVLGDDWWEGERTLVVYINMLYCYPYYYSILFYLFFLVSFLYFFFFLLLSFFISSGFDHKSWNCNRLVYNTALINIHIYIYIYVCFIAIKMMWCLLLRLDISWSYFYSIQTIVCWQILFSWRQFFCFDLLTSSSSHRYTYTLQVYWNFYYFIVLVCFFFIVKLYIIIIYISY